MKLTKKQKEKILNEKKELEKKRFKYGLIGSILLLPVGILSFLYLDNHLVTLVVWVFIIASIRPMGYWIQNDDKIKEIDAKLR